MSNSTLTHTNNFDFLRLFAAALVLFSHQMILGGQPEFMLLPKVTLGTLGVFFFFSISGFLVSASWRSDPHLLRFVAKRLLRIWPALIVLTLLTSLLLGPMISSLRYSDYFASPQLIHYLQTLFFQIQYELPGVFVNNPYPKAINGSLWSIPVEVYCYAVLLILGLFQLLKQRIAILVGTLLFIGIVDIAKLGQSQFELGYMCFFFVGVCLDLYQKEWRARPITFISATTGLAAMCLLMNYQELALLALIPPLVVWFGLKSIPIINLAGSKGDISYGLYLYAFLVQQCFFAVVGANFPFLPGLAITTTIVIGCAYLSWHFVERPALGFKRFIRRSTPYLADSANTGNPTTPDPALKQ
jgi:peptidoglycan/LPS O-acetylase OafA/YrhL